MKSSSENRPLPLDLADLPESLVPSDPRIGAECTFVSRARLSALEASGSVLLGRQPSGRDALAFRESVLSELRTLLRLSTEQRCAVVAGAPSNVYCALAVEEWGGRLDVVSSGRLSSLWREIVARRPRSALGLDRTEPASARGLAIAGVADEGAQTKRELDGGPVAAWSALDLSGTSGVLTEPSFAFADVSFFCAGTLFGVGAGCTIVVLSPRAFEASLKTRAELEARGLTFASLHLSQLLESTPSVADWLMLGNGVRARLESDLAGLEDAIQARFARVSAWAAKNDWLVPPQRNRGGSLVAKVRSTLPGPLLAGVAAFLEEHHLAYGLIDRACPDSFSVGLSDAIAVEELERVLSLISFLVEAAR